MSITINIDGSSNGSFSLGNGGSTLYSGTNPTTISKPQVGDIYFLSSPQSPQVLIFDGTTWQVPTGRQLLIMANQVAILQNGLQSEVTRAQNSESAIQTNLQNSLNNYLPISGGALTGGLTVKNIIGPNGGYVPELINSSSPPVIQSFTAKGTSTSIANYIAFPTAFRTIPQVFMSIDIEEQSSYIIPRFPNFTLDSTGYSPNITNSGFYFEPVYVANGAGLSGHPWTLQVLAIGSM